MPNSNDTILSLPLAQVYRVNQVRSIQDDDETIKDLANSLKEEGQLVPIAVSQDSKDLADGRYRVEHGERRLIAAEKAGLDHIDAILVPRPETEADRIVAQLTENIQREGMNVCDLASAIASLIAEGLTKADIARRLGKDPGYVSRLSSISEIKEGYLWNLLKAGQITDPIAIVCLAKVYDYSDKPEETIEAVRDGDGNVTRARARELLAHCKRVARGEPEPKPEIPAQNRAAEWSVDESVAPENGAVPAGSGEPVEPDDGSAGSAPWDDSQQNRSEDLEHPGSLESVSGSNDADDGEGMGSSGAGDCPWMDDVGNATMDERQSHSASKAPRAPKSKKHTDGSDYDGDADSRREREEPEGDDGYRMIDTEAGKRVHVRVAYQSSFGGEEQENSATICEDRVSSIPGKVAIELDTGGELLVDPSKLRVTGVDGDF